MSDSQKPTFSFGQPAGSSATSLTGKPASSTQAPSSGLFGSTPASSGSSGLFGNAATSSGGGGLFGSGTAPGGGSNIFGGGNKPSGGFTFAQTPASNSSGTGLFGSTPSTSQPSQPSNMMQSSTPSTFMTPSKPLESSTAQSETPKPLLGGGQGQAGGSLFSNIAQNPASTTPTNKPTTSIFANSTTPAGPPPNTNVGTSNSAFSFPKPQGQEKQSLSSTLPQFSSNAPSSTTATTGTPSNVFDTSSKGGSNLFANKDSQPSGAGLFSNLNKQAEGKTDGKPGLFQPPTQTQSSGLQSQPPASTSSTTPFTFAKTSAPSNTPNAAGFSLGGQSGASTGTATSNSNTTSSGLFSPAKPQENNANAAAASSSAPQTSSLFSGMGKSAVSKEVPTAAAAATESSGKAQEPSQIQQAALNTSTAGPAPPAVSRLKNKSMDDIITRWATDLSKYKKEFQMQAEKVARWDRTLVENSEKIQKLYGQTLQAERATTEVERQLTTVENDQAELESWLNYYEKEVDSMISQRGDSESATGPDVERQRTYQLAGRLTERLDDMGTDLTSMIEEINDSSSSLNASRKKDDPLSQVVQVLNSHLLQLQQIDQGAAALTLKIQEAQKQSRVFRPTSSNGSIVGGASNDAADGFWRSYMGRR